jgi:hypothetical protein
MCKPFRHVGRFSCVDSWDLNPFLNPIDGSPPVIRIFDASSTLVEVLSDCRDQCVSAFGTILN